MTDYNDRLDRNIDGTAAPVANDRIDALYRSSVIDASGDKIGSVGQVYLDDVTNEPTWITVNTGFLGLKESFIPMDKATIEGENIRVPFEKEFIKNAPAIDPDGHIDEAQEQELYSYYSMTRPTHDHARDGYVGTDRTNVDTTAASYDGQVVGDRKDFAGTDYDRTNIDRDAHLGDETILREERLNVGKEQVETGRAHIRKHVVTETQQVEVPVTREELVVERTPIADGERVAGNIGDKLGEGEQEIVLHEERPVVSKETVATEKVNVGTREVTETKTVQAEVGKEQVEVVQDGSINTTRDRNFVDGDTRLNDGITEGTNRGDYNRDGETDLGDLGDKVKDTFDGDRDRR